MITITQFAVLVIFWESVFMVLCSTLGIMLAVKLQKMPNNQYEGSTAGSSLTGPVRCSCIAITAAWLIFIASAVLIFLADGDVFTIASLIGLLTLCAFVPMDVVWLSFTGTNKRKMLYNINNNIADQPVGTIFLIIAKYGDS